MKCHLDEIILTSYDLDGRQIRSLSMPRFGLRTQGLRPTKPLPPLPVLWMLLSLYGDNFFLGRLLLHPTIIGLDEFNEGIASLLVGNAFLHHLLAHV